VRRGATVAILLIAICVAGSAEPIAERIPDIRAYTSAMRATLVDAGVEIRRLESPGDRLLIDYSVVGEDVSPEFALSAVLRLVAPLTDGADTVRVRQMRDGERLLELSLTPPEMAGVAESLVTEAESREIDALLEAAIAASGGGAPDVPSAELGADMSAPATVTLEGTAPVGGPDIPGFAAQLVTRPRSAAAVVIVTEDETEPESMAPPVDEDVLADDLYHRLVAESLENVSVARAADGSWIISFENRTWRSEIDALAAALDATANVLPPTDVILQMKRHDVVVSHVRVALADYVKLQAGMLSPEALADAWDVHAGPVRIEGPVDVLAEGNDSFLRTDILGRPAIDYTIGLENDPFESDYFLLTSVKTTVAPGLWANLRFPVQLTSDQKAAMDRALATWVGRPVDGVLATGSIGKFRDGLYGYYGEVRTDTDTHQFGVVGSLVDQQSNLSPTDKFDSAFAYYQYDWGELGLKARLGYGQFLESGQEGATLSLRRRFDESVIEARAIRTNDGDEGLMFGLSVPLGPRRASSPNTLRARTDTTFRIDYTSDFNVQGDYLWGPHDLESFRGEASPSYVQHHGERLLEGRAGDADGHWPAAPSYEGTSGLIRIPTADVAEDGRLFTGISYFDRDHSKVVGADTDAMPTFVGAGFLPNLELVGRITFFHDVHAFEWNYNLDRSFNAHYRLCDQRGDWLPALALGAQDVTYGTTTSYVGEAEYLVGTWRRDNFRAHLGLGSGKFDPVFGGLEMAITGKNRLHLMADYDSDYVNAGLRWFIGDWGTASVSVLGMEDVTGSVTFQTDLY